MKRNRDIYYWICQERKASEEIADLDERQQRDDLLDGIIDAVNGYRSHLWEYKRKMLFRSMEERGIIFGECQYSSRELKKRWEKAFASDLSKEKKKEIFFRSYLWHAFSYEALPALAKGKARQAFNRKKKTGVYVFYQNDDRTFYIKDAGRMKSSDLDMEDDIYIVDADMKWTYIHTHEIQCGPYYLPIILTCFKR